MPIYFTPPTTFIQKLQNDIAPQVKELFNCLETLKFAYRDLPDVDKQANRKSMFCYLMCLCDWLIVGSNMETAAQTATFRPLHSSIMTYSIFHHCD